MGGGSESAAAQAPDVGADVQPKGSIGRRVRIARRLAKLRAFDLAIALGRLVHTVYRWEGGHTDPSLPDCRRIVEITGCRYAWLMTGEGEPRSVAA